MSHVTLTTKKGESLDLTLPLKAEEFLTSPAPYYIAYGHATVAFDTPDEALNEALAARLPEKLDGGVKELSLLVYILGKTDEDGLAKIKESLPEQPSSVEEVFQGVYGKYELHRFAERHLQIIQREIDGQRMTGGQLFDAFMAQARENGDLARFDTIGDYELADDMEKGKLCSYEFDLLPIVNFGGSEGIYIDCSIRGKFDESGRNSLHIGTIKTLDTSLDACKVMGELCGTLMYHDSKFVNENLCRFDSAESIERMLTRPLAMEQMREETQTMCQQM
jgi:hypothetical protein